ncbi:MAG TPA: hypothetical protein DCS54_00515 [Oribacterium sp.]|jgi:ribosomal protein L40E|nr:hypothetical protein [Oribacterium sp.]
MKCNHCGNEIPDHADYCPFCHTPIIRIHPKRICSHCGTEVPDGAEQCPGCGRKVQRKAAQTSCPSSSSSRLGMDTYAWLQAILPFLAATSYHFLALKEHPGFNLVNTLLLFEGLTIFLGHMDIRMLSGWTEYGSSILTDRFIYLTYFLPAYSMWQRRELPGMNHKAWYPWFALILFTLFFFLILLSWNILQFTGENIGSTVCALIDIA